MKQNILNKPILYSFIIFMICLAIRIVEYFIIKTDTTFISENFIHKLVGIIILLFLLKIMNYKFKDIGLKKNKFFKCLIYGLILGGICFGISYFIEWQERSFLSRLFGGGRRKEKSMFTVRINEADVERATQLVQDMDSIRLKKPKEDT